MDDEFLAAFAQVVRTQIANNCEVHLPGVGTFSVEHKKQHQQQHDDGRVVMMPPKDRIKFVAEERT